MFKNLGKAIIKKNYGIMITNKMSILPHTTNEHATQMNEKNQTDFVGCYFTIAFLP